MLALCCLLLLLLPALAGWGRLTSKIFPLPLGGLAGLLLGGLVTVSLLATVFAFFFPLTVYFEVFVLLTGIGVFFHSKLYHPFYNFRTKIGWSFSLLLLLTMACGAQFPFILDHFGYYVPTIKWLTEAGLVRGISNLDLLLGQMSVWHIFTAVFSHFTDPWLRINVLVAVVFLVYAFENKRWMLLCLFPLFLLYTQSPSPDLPATAFSLIVLTEILQRNRKVSGLFFLSCFLFILKPTVIWLPFFTALYGSFILRKSIRFLLPGCGVLLLFVIKNFWTFGFPVFPAAVGDIGLPWTPAPELLQTSAEIAVQKTFDMWYTFEEIRNFTFLEGVRNWFFLPGLKGIIHVSFVHSIAVFALIVWRQKSRLLGFLFVAVIFKTICVLYFSAQYRFFIDVFFVVIFILFYGKISFRFSKIFSVAFSAGVASFLAMPVLLQTAVPSFNPAFYMRAGELKSFYRPSEYRWQKFSTHRVGNLTFNLVEEYPYSFTTPLPAISPYYLEEDVAAGIIPQRSGKGFTWRKMTASEKKRLQEIVRKNLYPSEARRNKLSP